VSPWPPNGIKSTGSPHHRIGLSLPTTTRFYRAASHDIRWTTLGDTVRMKLIVIVLSIVMGQVVWPER
jgi:hypothetical protein